MQLSNHRGFLYIEKRRQIVVECDTLETGDSFDLIPAQTMPAPCVTTNDLIDLPWEGAFGACACRLRSLVISRQVLPNK